MVELYRRHAWYASGMIFWMFNDCWPASLGWAFVDYYLRRKPSYYTFKRLSSDAVGSVDAYGKTLTVSNTSDLGITASISVRALDMKRDFAEVARLDECAIMMPYSTESYDVSGLTKSDDILLVIDVDTDEGSYRSYYKKGKLNVKRHDGFEIISKDEGSVTIRANTYLQAVELEGDYTFSDNYFAMLNGEEKVVTFEKFSDKADGVTVKSYTLM